jgi:hypothetical protein
MNNIKNLNIKLNVNNSLPNLKNFIKKEKMESKFSLIENLFKEKGLENYKFISIKKVTKITQLIIKLSDNIIYTNKSLLNLLKKNEYNLDIFKSENLNKELSKQIINESKLIFMNEQEYIKLISPFNFKLASINNHIYTFTNKSYKKINKNLHNLYIICKSAFLNMSSIISKPIISINSNLIKITLFYY